LIAAFSVLEIHLKTKGHVYGAFVSHVLETNEIRCAIQRLKVDVQRSVVILCSDSISLSNTMCNNSVINMHSFGFRWKKKRKDAR
jgi:hypothetical protein